MPDGVEVGGITHDSRAVHAGDVYAALPGANAHGADFTAGAAVLGAAAVLTDELGADRAASTGLPVLVVDDARAVLGTAAVWAYDEPARDLALVGITGTNGKTTTAYLVEAGLRAAGHVTGLIGTVETRAAGTTLPSVRTTPEATDLQALFAVMRESGVTAAAMEVSSHALALGRVDGTTYAVAVFTNLSQDHLDFHVDMEAYFAAKAMLFTPRYCRRAVINVDDAYGARLAVGATVPVTTLAASGRTQTADWRVLGSDRQWDVSTVEVAGPDGTRATLTVRLPGSFNIANATCAYVALVELGVPPAAAAAGIGALQAVPGRMERVDAGQPYLALVDYAHTPQAVETLLEQVREVAPGRVLLVLGCGGDRDASKRPVMGRCGARADVFVVTDDNSRSEDPAAIRSAMLAGAADVPADQRGEVLEIGDRRTAIVEAVRRARSGDVLVVAGKGHEQGQERAGQVSPFDDRAVLRAAIEAAA